jgi:hypothetical protein
MKKTVTAKNSRVSKLGRFQVLFFQFGTHYTIFPCTHLLRIGTQLLILNCTCNITTVLLLGTLLYLHILIVDVPSQSHLEAISHPRGRYERPQPRNGFSTARENISQDRFRRPTLRCHVRFRFLKDQ